MSKGSHRGSINHWGPDQREHVDSLIKDGTIGEPLLGNPPRGFWSQFQADHADKWGHHYSQPQNLHGLKRNVHNYYKGWRKTAAKRRPQELAAADAAHAAKLAAVAAENARVARGGLGGPPADARIAEEGGALDGPPEEIQVDNAPASPDASSIAPPSNVTSPSNWMHDDMPPKEAKDSPGTAVKKARMNNELAKFDLELDEEHLVNVQGTLDNVLPGMKHDRATQDKAAETAGKAAGAAAKAADAATTAAEAAKVAAAAATKAAIVANEASKSALETSKTTGEMYRSKIKAHEDCKKSKRNVWVTERQLAEATENYEKENPPLKAEEPKGILGTIGGYFRGSKAAANDENLAPASVEQAANNRPTKKTKEPATPGSRGSKRPAKEPATLGSRGSKRPAKEPATPGSRRSGRPVKGPATPGSRRSRLSAKEPATPGSRRSRRLELRQGAVGLYEMESVSEAE